MESLEQFFFCFFFYKCTTLCARLCLWSGMGCLWATQRKLQDFSAALKHTRRGKAPTLMLPPSPGQFACKSAPCCFSDFDLSGFTVTAASNFNCLRIPLWRHKIKGRNNSSALCANRAFFFELMNACFCVSNCHGETS